MRNAIESLDRYRTTFIKSFLAAFGLFFGFWIVAQGLLAFMRPMGIPFSGTPSPAWIKYFEFFISIEPVMRVSAISGLVIFGLLFTGWLLYKRQLFARPELGSAVRDERVRFNWLIAFRRAVAAAIILQLILWVLRNTWPFFVSGSGISAELGFLLTLFVLTVTVLWTFLRLDRRTKELDVGMTSVEAIVTDKAPALLGVYLAWHGLFIIGRVLWNWRILNMDAGRDDARIFRYLEISRSVHLVWLVLLVALIVIIIRTPRKSRPPADEGLVRRDERVWMNWLRACRFSFRLLLAWLIISALPWEAFNIWAGRLPHGMVSTVIGWGSLLAGLHMSLLVATAGLLGSYVHFNRQG